MPIMPKTKKKDKVKKLALKIIAENPGGIRYSALVEQIGKKSPDTPWNTIAGSIYDLNHDKEFPKRVSKPSPGLYVPISVSGDNIVPPDETEQVAKSDDLTEKDFYERFAQWLKEDCGEATEAAPLGGKSMREKYGTPDVIGVYRPGRGDPIQFQPEIISVEIKKQTQEPITAFGQAIAYRLFSSKVYIAMPKTMEEENLSRLEALCILFGVGLVLFDLNKDNPDFLIRVHAQRSTPDMFYANKFAEQIRNKHPEKYKRLFYSE